jgi:tRNA (mo5U34)-methyltransferase
MNPSEKRKLVESYKQWFHQIDFGDGIISKEGQCQPSCVQAWDFPEGYFKNKTVLDVGACDGYYSFYAERHGAASVTALDGGNWTHPEDSMLLSKKGFDIAKKILESNVDPIIMDIMEATPSNLGKFDVILFAGVLYHLECPLRSIKILDDLLNDEGSLFIETHFSHAVEDVPILQFHPKKSLNNDGSNFWSPNKKCLENLIEEVGDLTIDREWDDGGDRLIMYCTKNVH